VTDLDFERPSQLQATDTPEDRGVGRDGVRLLVTEGEVSRHHVFRELPDLLQPGDLLVVNESATIPASLPARGAAGSFVMNLSTRYAPNVWLAESRWSVSRPGPVPIGDSETIAIAGVEARRVAGYPGIDRLAFYRTEADLFGTMLKAGAPIRYGYLAHPHPLADYQTVFARIPGSSEMPSAGRPFSDRTLADLRARGVGIARLWLHTGVSSLELENGDTGLPPVYPEPFEVPTETATAIRRARRAGGRVVAVGTTVVRALETASDHGEVRPLRGFTCRVLGPREPFGSVDALITGLHDPRTSHLSLLFGFAGEARVRESYRSAVAEGYLWHEFGDSHLLWRAS